MSDYILMHKDEEVAQVKIGDSGIKLMNVTNDEFMPIGISKHRYKTLDEQITI